MKKLIKNILATTGLTLIILGIIATTQQAEFLFIRSIYQSFLANIMIHVGLLFVKKYESKYFYIEILLEISYVLSVLITSGFLFQWYCSTPLWVITLMGILIYFISYLINIFTLKEDISFINQQLNNRHKKNN